MSIAELPTERFEGPSAPKGRLLLDRLKLLTIRTFVMRFGNRASFQEDNRRMSEVLQCADCGATFRGYPFRRICRCCDEASETDELQVCVREAELLSSLI